MTKDCSTCIHKEGSCYPSTTIFDKDKTCKSYDPDYEGYIAELEKENAELKGLKDVATLIRANNDTVTTLMQLNNMLVSKSQQLTKAKEIIEKLRALYLSPVVTKDDVKRQDEILNEVEQFLNSEVEK